MTLVRRQKPRIEGSAHACNCFVFVYLNLYLYVLNVGGNRKGRWGGCMEALCVCVSESGGLFICLFVCLFGG